MYLWSCRLAHVFAGGGGGGGSFALVQAVQTFGHFGLPDASFSFLLIQTWIWQKFGFCGEGG